MSVAAALFAYAVLLTWGTRLLQQPWVARAPRAAIALWQLATATIVLAVLVGFCALIVPAAAGHGLAALVGSCLAALRAGFGAPAGQRVLSLVGAAGAGTVMLRMVACVTRDLWRTRRQRRRHLDALELLGRVDRTLGAVIIDHGTPAVYCVPGRRRRIVLTTAALAALDADQLAVVLTHERAHLRGRHDLVLALGQAMASAFPLRVFRVAAAELTVLVEMLADDAVHGPGRRRSLAGGLVVLAAAGTDASRAVLAAAASGVLPRVQRLVKPAQPIPHAMTLSMAVAGVLLTAAPLLMGAVAVAATAGATYCPLPG